MDLEVKFTGGDALEKALRLLPADLERKAVTQALRAGANIIVKEAKSRAPVKTGTLKKNIKAKIVRSRDTGGYSAQIGILKKAWYGRLIETGYSSTGRKKKGKNKQTSGTTIIPANPFFRQAAQARQSEVIKAISQKIAEFINKLAK